MGSLDEASPRSLENVIYRSFLALYQKVHSWHKVGNDIFVTDYTPQGNAGSDQYCGLQHHQHAIVTIPPENNISELE